MLAIHVVYMALSCDNSFIFGHLCNIPGVSPNWLSPLGNNCNDSSTSPYGIPWVAKIGNFHGFYSIVLH